MEPRSFTDTSPRRKQQIELIPPTPCVTEYPDVFLGWHVTPYGAVRGQFCLVTCRPHGSGHVRRTSIAQYGTIISEWCRYTADAYRYSVPNYPPAPRWGRLRTESMCLCVRDLERSGSAQIHGGFVLPDDSAMWCPDVKKQPPSVVWLLGVSWYSRRGKWKKNINLKGMSLSLRSLQKNFHKLFSWLGTK